MTPSSTRRPATPTGTVIGAAIGALIGITSILAATGPVAATGDQGDGSVVIENAGDPATAIVLPPVAVVGQRVTSSSTIDATVTAAGQDVVLGLELDLSAEVTAVEADGGYISVLTIDRIELSDAPEGVDPDDLGYDQLVGVRFEQTSDRGGRVVSAELLDADQLSGPARESAEGITNSLQTAQFVYPTEPIGIGAVWTADQEIVSEGFVLPVTYRFEVTRIGDGRFALTFSYESEFDTTIQGISATGTVSGSGTSSGSLDNPLDVSVDVDQTIDASAAGTDLTIAIALTTTTK